LGDKTKARMQSNFTRITSFVSHRGDRHNRQQQQQQQRERRCSLYYRYTRDNVAWQTMSLLICVSDQLGPNQRRSDAKREHCWLTHSNTASSI